MMVRAFVILLTVATLGSSCAPEVYRIKKHSLPRQNPTSYTFPFPVQELRARALEAFSIDNQIKEPIFKFMFRQPFWRDTVDFDEILTIEVFTDVVFSKALFEDPANSSDIYLHAFHSPIGLSSVYRRWDGAGHPFIANFHLHFTEGASNDTIVTVTALDTEVITGRRAGFYHGLGYAAEYESVEPTTVEEYVILRYLGNYLDISNMPDIVLPP